MPFSTIRVVREWGIADSRSVWLLGLKSRDEALIVFQVIHNRWSNTCSIGRYAFLGQTTSSEGVFMLGLERDIGWGHLSISQLTVTAHGVLRSEIQAICLLCVSYFNLCTLPNSDLAFLQTLGLLDPVDVLDGARLTISKIFQPFLHTIKTSGHNLVWVPTEPALFQAQAEESEPGIA